jgi:hypothetical protein
MASECADSLGAMSVCACSITGLVCEELSTKNTVLARVSSWPERSSATMVFSKVGAALLLAIAATSWRCSAMPASSAGT